MLIVKNTMLYYQHEVFTAIPFPMLTLLLTSACFYTATGSKEIS